MMSGIPGPPPGGGPLNGSSLVPNATESFSDQNLLPDVVKSELNPIKSEQVTIKSEFQPHIINGVLGDGNTLVQQIAPAITTVHSNVQHAPQILKIESQSNIRHIMPQPQNVSQPQQAQQLGSQQLQPRPVGVTGQTMRPGIRQVVLSSPAGGGAPALQPRLGTPRQTRPIAPTGGTPSTPAGGAAPVLTEEEQKNVHKCKNFLMTLIQLAQRNSSADRREVVTNVRDLVQRLIDDRITAQVFTERLQTELQSSPQPYLVPFLENSLPLLRKSMQLNSTSRPNAPRPVRPVQQVRLPQGTPTRPIRPGIAPTSIRPSHPQIRLPRNMPNARIRPGQTISRVPGEPPNKMKISTMDRDDQRENDDITDVANMAQIDLANEAENLNNASTVVGSEVKSAPGGDKAVSVNEQVLHKLVGQAASKAGGIQRVTPDGARLMGLALEDHIKTIISKAIHAASHRSIQFKETEHIEKLNDVKSQFKYISDLMIIEKRDADEAEQEQRAKLLRSRKGKDDDPDRDKKKKEAKMKQQQLQDEQQLKQADETALEASRRRPRNVASSSTTLNTSNNKAVRSCRVKIRDLLFCLDSDRNLSERSRDEVFKRYLK